MKRAEKLIRENANILAENEVILDFISETYCIHEPNEELIRNDAELLAEEEYILGTIAQCYCIADGKLIKEPLDCKGCYEFGDCTYCLDNMLRYLKKEVEE